MNELTMGSLFDGIGGFPLAAVRNGITPVWASEIEPFPIEVTKTHFPDMVHVGDITKLNGADLPPVDIICGGSPCQDLSIASCTRAGLQGARSGLFMEQIRLTKEMRDADILRGRTGKLVAPDTSAGRTSQAASAQARRTGRISGLSWRKLLDYIAPDYQFLDLSSDAGNLLGQYEWTIRSALHGECWLRNTGPSPRDAIESFLSQILQAHPPKKYYLTTAACLGILRRAEERGKPLPKALDTALRIQAGLTDLQDGSEGKTSDNKVGVSGILTKGNGDASLMSELDYSLSCGGGQAGQGYPCVLTAAFSAGAGASAGTIGYAEEVSPTLKGSPSGNCMPSVMCLHDQGGQRMDVCENMTGTLRASEKGHQPLVYENHGVDARIRESGEVSPTVTARYGTGGGNTPLVQESNEVYCIVGNIIDRQPENGGNGCGYQENLAYTITTCDRLSGYPDKRSNPED